MENKVDDFVAGVEATFGQLARRPEELPSFLRAAEDFYLDFIRAPRPSTSTQSHSQLPFWRYLIYYTTLLLDHAARVPSEQEEGKYRDLASELSSCWPLLSVLVTKQYHTTEPTQLDAHLLASQNLTELRPKKHGSPTHEAKASSTSGTLPPRKEVAVQTDDEDQEPPSVSMPTRPRLPRHPSIMRAVEPVTPPILYAEEDFSTDPDDVPIHPPPSPSTTLWDAYLERATSGRSLSESTQMTTTSNSTMPSDVLLTPPQLPAQSLFHVNEEHPYPASSPMGRNFSSSSRSEIARARSDSTTPTLRNSHPHQRSSDAKILLADRGDSTAKIVTKPQEGKYELDVEIGGHSVIFDPDKPTQVRYRGPKPAHLADQSNKQQELQTKVLLADRGDNTVKLVPTSEGTYVLDVSIGGRKLLVNPERPAEIQYHDQKGAVVTQSLISPAIQAQ